MDFPFIKEALTQLFSKPSTVQYPFEPAPAKPNYRGRIIFHPDKCINCNMCERVCAGQAISHVSEPCEEGERITRFFYLGSCTFCSHCASFCTHGAIELSGDYHMIATKEEDLIVSGNETQLAQLMLNLILNAYHAMEGAGGTLTLSMTAEENQAVLRVQDEGSGIRQEALPHIFDPFFTTKESGYGTGLGLAIVQRVAQIHSGSITVESTSMHGTTFALRIPLAKSERINIS